MEQKEILENWRFRGAGGQARVDLWNSMARGFGEQVLPTFQNDGFLRLLEQNEMIDKHSRVLDVGCGVGGYSLALAGRCAEVTGVDLSPRMIDLAKRKASEKNAENVRFLCADWQKCDLCKKKFDLVFAHMTPAVQSADTFLKLLEASRGWCALSKPTHRTDPVSDAVKRLVGIAENRENGDRDILYAFELLWQRGLLPLFQYERQKWKMEKTPEEAFGLYGNRVKTYREITPEEERKIRRYLGSIAQDGLVRETVDVTVTTIYWHV